MECFFKQLQREGGGGFEVYISGGITQIQRHRHVTGNWKMRQLEGWGMKSQHRPPRTAQTETDSRPLGVKIRCEKIN